jgi:cytochrome c oxidase assembly factor CtaG
VQAALDRPGPAAVVTAWTVQPVAIAVAVLLAAGYALGLRRLGRPWPRWRTAVFVAGLLLYVWTSCGFPQVYGRALYWVWTSKTLVLWLLVPIVVLSGHPVQLARTLGGASGRIDRLLRSRTARVIANPLVGPALVPVLSAVLFFGPLPAWTQTAAPAGWLLDLVLLVVGALMVLPLVGLDDDVSSLAVGLSLAIGSFELVLDALPGIVLRLHTGLVTSWFDHRPRYGWTPTGLHDQQIAGAVLWCVAELIDLPFLVLVYRRWLRADARDAARVDAVLEAERAARQALLAEDAHDDADAPRVEVDRDAPWWLSDPAMQQRLRRQG